MDENEQNINTIVLQFTLPNYTFSLFRRHTDEVFFSW